MTKMNEMSARTLKKEELENVNGGGTKKKEKIRTLINGQVFNPFSNREAEVRLTSASLL